MYTEKLINDDVLCTLNVYSDNIEQQNKYRQPKTTTTMEKKQNND